MNTKTINSLLILLIAIFVILSCSDDYLSVKPEDTLTDQTFFKNGKDAQTALIGVYNILVEQAAWGNVHNAAYIDWGITHDMYEMDRSQGRIELHSLQFPASNTYLADIYETAYKGIARSNAVIEKVPEIKAVDTDIKNTIVAQAKYCRGMFYYNLAQYFGGVPLVLKTLEASSDFNIPRSSRKETWAQIVSDFTESANALPLTWSEKDVGRATKTAAWAFLVKSYLWQNNWDKVLKYSELIINSNQHGLLPDYRDVFRKENDNNKEIIFSTQYRGDIPGMRNILAIRSAPRGAPAVFVGASAWSNYVPAKQWVRGFKKDDNGYIIDRRYNETVIGPGEKHQDVNYTLPVNPPRSMTVSGYILTKYWFGVPVNNGGFNAPVIRYPEILLSYAEALNEVGRQEEAMKQVNMIRKRAGLAPKPLNLPHDEVLNAIFREYRFEFMWEPVGGFATLNRRGRFLSFLKKNYLKYKSLNVDNKPWLHTQPILLPIPSRAYEVNKALVQNPKYPPFK